MDGLELFYELESEEQRPKVKFTKLDSLPNDFFDSLYEPLSKCYELELWNSHYKYRDKIYDYDLLVCFNKKYAIQLRFEDDPEEIILELIYRYAEREIRPKVSFKDTLRTLEKCLGQTEIKNIKLSVMAISCHKRLPRRHYSERSKHTLTDSDLRCVYRELGYEECSGNTMIKYLTCVY
jgi:AAA15 family ATPase/GTPase